MLLPSLTAPAAYKLLEDGRLAVIYKDNAGNQAGKGSDAHAVANMDPVNEARPGFVFNERPNTPVSVRPI